VPAIPTSRPVFYVGRHINIDKAINIGLRPDVERGKFEYLGNSSIAGAYLALLSEKIRKEALQGRFISNRKSYVYNKVLIRWINSL